MIDRLAQMGWGNVPPRVLRELIKTNKELWGEYHDAVHALHAAQSAVARIKAVNTV